MDRRTAISGGSGGGGAGTGRAGPHRARRTPPRSATAERSGSPGPTVRAARSAEWRPGRGRGWSGGVRTSAGRGGDVDRPRRQRTSDVHAKRGHGDGDENPADQPPDDHDTSSRTRSSAAPTDLRPAVGSPLARPEVSADSARRPRLRLRAIACPIYCRIAHRIAPPLAAAARWRVIVARRGGRVV